MELKKASEIAVAVCQKLQPFCNKIHIAGSIRRKKLEVKDIEIVVEPKLVTQPTNDLFGAGAPKEIIHPQFILTVDLLGKIEKGKATGRYCKIILPEGIALDLFIPEPSDFFRQYAIRTGSADYSHKILAAAWRRKGWVGSDIRLRQEKDCIEHKQPDGKSKWVCMRNKDEKPPIWTDEKDFFNWLGINYVEPQYRNI